MSLEPGKSPQPSQAPESESSYDFGFGSSYKGNQKHLLNPNGSFNIHRQGSAWNLYQWLVRLSWPKFWLLLLSLYVGINLFFAGLFFACGPQAIANSQTNDWGRLLDAFFSASKP